MLRHPDIEETAEQRNDRHERVRRTKKVLRHVPRKANVHRYPIIKWFAESARKRAYLWSFRQENIIPALYAGWIVTLMPLYGCQIPIAFLLALLLRGNFMILAGLQLISNPLTIAPIYWLDYQIGEYIFSFFGPDSTTAMTDSFTLETGEAVPVKETHYMRYVLATMVGGAIWGYICGVINVVVYKMTRKSWIAHHPAKKAGQTKKETPK